jgi:hypothetical protein
MGVTNGEAVKTDFPEPAVPTALYGLWGGGVVWRGNGFQRFLIANRLFLGHVRFGCDFFKSTGPKRGPCLAFLPTSFSGRNLLIA